MELNPSEVLQSFIVLDGLEHFNLLCLGDELENSLQLFLFYLSCLLKNLHLWEAVVVGKSVGLYLLHYPLGSFSLLLWGLFIFWGLTLRKIFVCHNQNFYL